MPLLRAFNHINQARKDLEAAKKGLEKIKSNYEQEVVVLLPKVEELLTIAQAATILITRHPQWSHFIAVQEMRIANIQPKMTYQIN